MMKEPWWELVAPLITVLFPPASNVRKNTQWHVCKRASTKLLSGKINGGSCSPHSDLRGQLVTAPWRCWGQQCSGSVSWRDGERHPHAPPTLGGKKKNVGECPLCSWLSDLCMEESWFPTFAAVKEAETLMIKLTTVLRTSSNQFYTVHVTLCTIIEWKK